MCTCVNKQAVSAKAAWSCDPPSLRKEGSHTHDSRQAAPLSESWPKIPQCSLRSKPRSTINNRNLTFNPTFFLTFSVKADLQTSKLQKDTVQINIPQEHAPLKCLFPSVTKRLWSGNEGEKKVFTYFGRFLDNSRDVSKALMRCHNCSTFSSSCGKSIVSGTG